jgi:MSHA pilin protein MshC
VSLDNNGYWLRQSASCSGGVSYNVEVQGPDGQRPFANTQVPIGVTITATNFPVVFDSLGRPLGGAAKATIGSFTLNVTAETGMVQ